MKVALVGVPIDVKPPGVVGRLPPFQHIEPEGLSEHPNPMWLGTKSLICRSPFAASAVLIRE
jgi:hypothetical protein